VLYITYIDLYDINYTGIRKKIFAQIEVFKRKFTNVYYTCYAGSMMYLIKDKQILEKELAITRKESSKVIELWIEQYKIKKIYIRYAFSDKWFLELVRNIKKMDIRTVLEIPTYPYDGELNNQRIKLEDGYYRRRLKRYIDFVATNTDTETIWGINCIKLVNGVELKSNPIQKKQPNTEKNIVMIAVGTLMEWQGYERMIQGIYNYYIHGGKHNLLFKIVGEGPEKEIYQALIEHYHVEQYVELCGRLEGEELDTQYALADIAVSSLGRYKSNVHDFSPIKGAEYCARGIPFICGYHDIRFKGNENFIMNVSNAPEPIDMDQVIAFYRDVSGSSGYQTIMREYAAQYLSWDIVMSRIVNVLQ